MSADSWEVLCVAAWIRCIGMGIVLLFGVHRRRRRMVQRCGSGMAHQRGHRIMHRCGCGMVHLQPMGDLKEPPLKEDSKASPTLTNRQWILKSRPQGIVEPTDFEQRTVTVPKPPSNKGKSSRKCYICHSIRHNVDGSCEEQRMLDSSILES